MKWNETEVAGFLSSKPPDWEGRLCYKPPKSSGTFSLEPVFKERYFKLLGNLLYCLRLGPDSKGDSSDPVMVMVLENFSVSSSSQAEESPSLCTFSLNFRGDESSASPGEKRHMFVADSARTVTQWIEALKNCSYEYKREQLILLQIKLRNKTGVDPLRATSFQYNPVYFLNNRPSRDPTLLRSPPDPPQRKAKYKNGSSGFTSHIGIQHWERGAESNCDQVKSISASIPSFKSHLNDNTVPEEEKLIDF